MILENAKASQENETVIKHNFQKKAREGSKKRQEKREEKSHQRFFRHVSERSIQEKDIL